jgi:signal transduction histidine kinase/tetratricopeptide (TPR) repeat protein
MRRIIFIVLLVFLFIRLSYADNDSLRALLPDTFNVDQPMHYITLISKYNTDKENSELARYLISEGNKLGKEIKNDTFIVQMNYLLADNFFYREDYKKAYDLYQQVLPSFKEFGDTLFTAKTINSIGLIFSYRNDNENTLKYYLEALELLKKVKRRTPKIDTEEIIVRTNLINHYRETRQYRKVIEHALPAIVVAREIGDSVRLASIMNSLGNGYKNMNQIDKSLETFREAVGIFESMGDEFRKAFVFINIGGVFDYIHQTDSSLKYYAYALKTFKEEGYVFGELNALTGMAGDYVIQRKDQEARKIFLSCIDTALAYGFNDIVLESYSAMADLEYKSGNYKQAYDFKERYRLLNDSIFTVEKEHQYAELQTQYETVQKENEINLLKSEKLIRENELRRNKLINWIALSALIILLVIFYVGYVFYKQKRKANALLTEKNNQIELKNRQLSQMNQQIVHINEKLQLSQVELTNANNAKNRFFSILGHDLRNPFHSIMGYSYLLSKSYDKLSVDERKKYADEILGSCEQVNRLLDNLLEWIRTQSDGITFNPHEVEFYRLVQDALSVLKNSANDKSIEIVSNIDKGIKITADYSMIETVVRNLVNNGIKFTPVGGKVTISATLEASRFTVNVSDNGVGIPAGDLDKLFNVDSNIKTRGTNNERGTGLGLVICKEFVNFHNGQIWAESEVGKGTTFYFSIPASQ